MCPQVVVEDRAGDAYSTIVAHGGSGGHIVRERGAQESHLGTVWQSYGVNVGSGHAIDVDSGINNIFCARFEIGNNGIGAGQTDDHSQGLDHCA